MKRPNNSSDTRSMTFSTGSRVSCPVRSPAVITAWSVTLIAHMAAPRSESLGHVLERVGVRLAAPDLALGQLDLGCRHFLVRNMREEVTDHVQAHGTLVLRACDIPGRPRAVGRGEHLVARPGV